MGRTEKRIRVVPRTIKAWRRLHEEEGKNIVQIAKKYGCSPVTVGKYLALTGGLDYEMQKHLDRVLELIGILRSCLTSPQFHLVADTNRLPLELNGEDWRLDPLYWFELCTPDVSDKSRWANDFLMVWRHTEKSVFWEHLEQLRTAAQALQKEYDEAALESAKQDEGFAKFWQRIKGQRVWLTRTSRIADRPLPSEEEYKPYYSAQKCEMVMELFSRRIQNLGRRQWDLEKLLQRLHDDLYWE